MIYVIFITVFNTFFTNYFLKHLQIKGLGLDVLTELTCDIKMIIRTFVDTTNIESVGA